MVKGPAVGHHAAGYTDLPALVPDCWACTSRPGRKQREAAKRKSDHGLHGVKADKLVKRQKRANTWVRGQGSTPMTPEEARRRQKRAQRFANGPTDDMEQDSDEVSGCCLPTWPCLQQPACPAALWHGECC